VSKKGYSFGTGAPLSIRTTIRVGNGALVPTNEPEFLNSTLRQLVLSEPAAQLLLPEPGNIAYEELACTYLRYSVLQLRQRRPQACHSVVS
jgi:hypothetical protein